MPEVLFHSKYFGISIFCTITIIFLLYDFNQMDETVKVNGFILSPHYKQLLKLGQFTLPIFIIVNWLANAVIKAFIVICILFVSVVLFQYICSVVFIQRNIVSNTHQDIMCDIPISISWPVENMFCTYCKWPIQNIHIILVSFIVTVVMTIICIKSIRYACIFRLGSYNVPQQSVEHKRKYISFYNFCALQVVALVVTLVFFVLLFVCILV